MSKDHWLKTRTPLAKQSAMPINFLLGCSQDALGQFELARLAEVADLRKEVIEILDRMVDAMSQAALAAWFRAQDRQSLKHAIENEESPEEWAKRMIRDGQRSKEELDGGPMPSPHLFRPSLPPGAAHLAASLRYKERNIAEGKCEKCPQPLDRNSVRYCTKHLAWARTKSARQRGAKGEPGSREYLYGEADVTPSTQGRQPGTPANLAMQREKRKRALLMEAGVKPEHAAVSFNAAIEALAKIMPRSRADAMTQTELFEKAGVISKTTGGRALAEILEAGAIERIGAGGIREPYRYWRKVEP